MKASATVKLTGEVIEFDCDSTADVVTAYRVVNETMKAYEVVKEKLRKRAQELASDGHDVEHDGYAIKVFTTQRMQYDKAVLRQVFDEDLVDLFLEPAKGRIDDYLKEHLEELGDASTRLRESMVPTGQAYTTVRIEKLTREGD